MTELEVLEAALRARLDPETLAVYADFLQSIGDVRGELIALDLEIARTGTTLARDLRREQLLHDWLGTPRVGTPRFGFVTLDLVEDFSSRAILEAALDGPGGRFVQTITVAGHADYVARVALAISRAPRPWLTRLVLHDRDALEPAIPQGVWSRLVAAAPQLDTLELAGCVVETLHHPTVRRLRVTGLAAFQTATMPAVTDLDLAFCGSVRDVVSEHSAPAAIAIIDALPALTRLDLSRCGAGFVPPVNLGGGLPVFPLLSELRAGARLVELRLPPVITVFDASEIDTAIARMPALTKLVLFQTSNALARLVRHPRIAVELA